MNGLAESFIYPLFCVFLFLFFKAYTFWSLGSENIGTEYRPSVFLSHSPGASSESWRSCPGVCSIIHCFQLLCACLWGGDMNMSRANILSGAGYSQMRPAKILRYCGKSCWGKMRDTVQVEFPDLFCNANYLDTAEIKRKRSPKKILLVWPFKNP